MIQIRDKYKGIKISNGNIPTINTNDIPPKMYKYYYDNGFEFIFEEVKKSNKKATKKKSNNDTSK